MKKKLQRLQRFTERFHLTPQERLVCRFKRKTLSYTHTQSRRQKTKLASCDCNASQYTSQRFEAQVEHNTSKQVRLSAANARYIGLT